MSAADEPGILATIDLESRQEEGDSGGSLTYDERSATLTYAGVRKLVSVDGGMASLEDRPARRRGLLLHAGRQGRQNVRPARAGQARHGTLRRPNATPSGDAP